MARRRREGGRCQESWLLLLAAMKALLLATSWPIRLLRLSYLGITISSFPPPLSTILSSSPPLPPHHHTLYSTAPSPLHQHTALLSEEPNQHLVKALELRESGEEGEGDGEE